MWWFAEPGRFVRACLAFGLGAWVRMHAAELPALDFYIELETVLRHDDGQFLWFHPRPTATPEGAILTLQKHLKVSEGMFMKDSRARGAEGATFVARIRWSVPNQDFPQFSKNPEK
jgi:hypothetical protein